MTIIIMIRNNTRNTVMPDYTVEMRARCRIQSGEEISNQYMRPDTPAYLRRLVMREKWFFDCSCSRCMSPTELGSYYGSVLCSRTRCGGALVSSDTSDNDADHECQSCGERVSMVKIRSILSEAESVMETVESGDGVIEHYERVLFRLSSLLHPGNYLMLEIKQKLGLLYGNIFPHTINKMKTPAKERKVQVCEEVIRELTVLERGVSEMMIVMMTEVAKMKTEEYLSDNPDPDGRRGMMARFMMIDNMLTLTNCLQLYNK